MRCHCCNTALSDFEATMRHAETDEYLDTCTECLSVVLVDVALPIKDNRELLLKDNTFDADDNFDGSRDDYGLPLW